MSTPSIAACPTVTPAPRLSRRVAPVLVGLVTVAALSHAADAALRASGVFPAGGAELLTGHFILAASYRLAFGVAGGFVTAALAPRARQRQLLILGGVGTLLSLLGLLAALAGAPGPLWYPLVLVLGALPSAWVGGWLERRVRARRGGRRAPELAERTRMSPPAAQE